MFRIVPLRLQDILAGKTLNIILSSAELNATLLKIVTNNISNSDC